MDEIVDDIKRKKELQGISDAIVAQNLKKYLRSCPKAKTFLQSEFSPRSSAYRKIVKEIRAELRRSFGLFRKGTVQIPTSFTRNSVIKILESHASTKERLPHYAKLYKAIFKITGRPDRLLDLGCGLNPFSSIFMPKTTYYAYDISNPEINAINAFFKVTKRKGEAKILDITDTGKVAKLPKADVAFLFKMTDILDKGKGHKRTEAVVKAVPARFVVVSFPTLTISGKRMNFPRRKWFELMCQRLGFSFKLLEFPGESFYVVKK